MVLITLNLSYIEVGFLSILQISKDDFLPKKICERCILRLEQFYEWKAICVQSDTVLRNYSDSMRAVTATINFQVNIHTFSHNMCVLCVYHLKKMIFSEKFARSIYHINQDGTVNVDKMTTEQKNSYLEAHMEVQQHMHHVSMQLNKPAQNHSTTHNQSMVSNQGISGTHQSGSSANVSNPYLSSNPIKVSYSIQ